MNFPENLKYTKDHEWVSLQGDIATIGVTDFAQSELGDIVFVEINPIGSVLNQHDTFGSVEAVKTVSDLFMPIAGELAEMNAELNNAPDLVNTDPYGKGWMVKVKVADSSQYDALMSAADYKALIGQ